MTRPIPVFGNYDPTVEYILRPGGYAIIARENREIAVVKTPQGCFLPGGGQETGESFEQAALREAREECGLDIRIIRSLGVADELVYSELHQRHYRKRCSFFQAEMTSTELTQGEPDHQLVWMPFSQALIELKHASQRWALGL
jgi:8-oxo-dGTP diphosphatase